MSALTEDTVGSRVPSPVAGLAVAATIGLVSWAVGVVRPTLGAPVVAVIIGAALSPLLRARTRMVEPGLGVAKGLVLQLAVVLLGAQLSLAEVARVGLSSLPVMVGTLAACLAVAWAVGRLLGIGADLTTLIGVGTGICGASAIAAVSPTIRAKHTDVAYAISTIFLFNVLAVLAFPPLGHALGLGQHQFGLFAGTAVNDTSSVVAAASSYGSIAAQRAVVVKLVRTLMIIPITLALAGLTARRGRAERAAGGAPKDARTVVRLVPWFLLGFLVMVAANTAGAVPALAQQPIKQLAVLLIAIALAAVGLSTDLRALKRTGARPLLLGLVLWVTVAATSLGLQLAG